MFNKLIIFQFVTLKFMSRLKTLVAFAFVIAFCNPIISQDKPIQIEGLVLDESNYSVPYAAVGIPSKYIGTATTEEGTFLLQLSKSNLSDSLEVSSIGYKTFKIKVQDLIEKKEKTLVLEEDIVSLGEVSISASSDYAKLAVKNLRKTTVNRPHQLNVLYRRFSVEDGKARFLVEHYLNVLDYGIASGEFLGEEIVAGRKSADYRFIKKKLKGHPINVITRFNPLRAGFRLKDYNWSKTGDTSYDGEDIIIVEGRNKKNKRQFIRLFIGMESNGVYKLETSVLRSLYIYKKDKDGKLHLSYHNRIRTSKVTLTETQKKVLNTDANTVTESYKHEVYVLGIERDKKIVNSGNYIKYKEDIGDIKIPYNPEFWNNFNLPPETAFYKKSVKELESIFGVPLEIQFKAMNN